MPSVCLSVDDLQMAHCCMPSALSHSGQNQSPSIGTEGGKKIWKVHLSCTEQNGPCCQGSQFMSRRKAEKKGCVKAHCTFFFFFSPPLFFLLWSVFVCSPFAVLTKQFDDWRHVFFMWDSVAVICRETAIFYPQLLFMGSKCQKLLQFPKWIW